MATDLAAWLLTYALHSTLFLLGAWIITRMIPERARILREAMWKTALVGGILTASVQVAFAPPVATHDASLTDAVCAAVTGGEASESGAALVDATSTDHSLTDATLSNPTRNDVSRADDSSLRDDARGSKSGTEYSIRLGLPGFGDESAANNPGALGDASNAKAKSAPKAAPGNEERSTDGLSLTTRAQLSDLTRLAETIQLQTLSLPFRGQNIALPNWLLLSLAGVWCAGAAIGIVRIVRGQLALRSLLRDRAPVESGSVWNMLRRLCQRSGVTRSVRLTDCPRVAGPMAVGLREICVPSRALVELPPTEQNAMLAHELGHLVRRDPLWLAIACVIERLFFFQPLNRLARRRLQEEAEFLCDDWAVDQIGEGLDLARCLATVAGWTRGLDDAVPTSAMAGSASPLVQRVRRLVEGRPHRPGRLVRGLGLPFGFALIAAIGLLAPTVRAKVARDSVDRHVSCDCCDTPASESGFVVETPEGDIRVDLDVSVDERNEAGAYAIAVDDASMYAIAPEAAAPFRVAIAPNAFGYAYAVPHARGGSGFAGPRAPRAGVSVITPRPGARPIVTPLPPMPPMPPFPDQIRPIVDSGRFTLRFENEEGQVDVRMRDGNVRAVRLDGVKLDADQYAVDDDILTVFDEDGDVLLEVDIDVDRRVRVMSERFREMEGRLADTSEHIARITASTADLEAVASELAAVSSEWADVMDEGDFAQIREELQEALAEVPMAESMDWSEEFDDETFEALEQMADELEAEVERLREALREEYREDSRDVDESGANNPDDPDYYWYEDEADPATPDTELDDADPQDHSSSQDHYYWSQDGALSSNSDEDDASASRVIVMPKTVADLARYHVADVTTPPPTDGAVVRAAVHWQNVGDTPAVIAGRVPIVDRPGLTEAILARAHARPEGRIATLEEMRQALRHAADGTGNVRHAALRARLAALARSHDELHARHSLHDHAVCQHREVIRNRHVVREQTRHVIRQ